MLYIFLEDSTSRPPVCFEDPFHCWWEKKQQLKKNIARVCNKYADYIDKISGRVRDKKYFLHYDKMVYCIIQKVKITINSKNDPKRIFLK